MIRPALRLAVLGAALLVAASPAAAASCNGASHEPTLTNGTASPGSGPPGTVVTFSVRYADTAGCAPSPVTVTVVGVGTYRLTGSGAAYQAGVTFSASLTIPPGTHGYSFRATSGDGRGEKTVTLTSVNPSAVVISSPTQPPTQPPTAGPPPPPPPAPTINQPPVPVTPPPTSAPTTTATATATAEGGGSTPSGGGPAAGPTGTAASGGGAGLTNSKGPDGFARARVTAPEPPPIADERLALPVIVPGWLVAYAASTAGGLALFFVLAQRRTAPVEAHEIVSEAAPTTSESAPVPSVTAPRLRDLVPPPDPDLLRDPDGPVGPTPEEAGVPRWLRTSLRQARLGPDELRRRDWH